MSIRPLVLAGTREARALAQALDAQGIGGVFSLAGRVDRPLSQPLTQRIGGFGGVGGLANYLRTNAITHVVDATHPFAAQMSSNAVAACQMAGLPLVALTRPAWQMEPGDQWHCVASMAQAVAALDRPAARVMLAVGRMHLDDFAVVPQHSYVLRLVDPPKAKLCLPNAEVIVDRGPFKYEADLALLRDRKIEIVVSKNAGGSGAYAKIHAARSLGLPVIMIDRPHIPARREVGTIQAVLDALHDSTNLGV